MTEADKTELLGTLTQIKTLAAIALAVEPEAIKALQDEISRTETLAPILDPTWYMRSSDNMQDHCDLVNAFAKFRSALSKFEDKLAEVEDD